MIHKATTMHWPEYADPTDEDFDSHVKKEGDLGWELVSVVRANCKYRFFWKKAKS